jgi:hypothetical protein
MSGFASLADRFPFFPEVGQQGAGGDVGLALADATRQIGLVGILAFLDGHGEPLTTGKFPRYWPHERQAWVDTLMVKYTAGAPSGQAGTKFSQSLRSSVGFLRDTSGVRWRAMSNVDGHFSLGGNADGCDADGTGPLPGAWCEFYVTVDGSGNNHLYVTKSADGNTDTVTEGSTTEITYSTRVDTMSAGTFSGGVGKILKTQTLNNLEKLPTIIDDRLAQVDADLDGFVETGESWGSNGDPAEPGQALFSQFQVVSGPNFHSEEGADPYSWVICGNRGMEYGEDDCVADSAAGKGAIDAGGHAFAIVYTPQNNTYTLGENPLTRFGRDINPRRVGNTLYPSSKTDGLDPDTTQEVGAFVECSTVQTAIHPTSTCVSDPGLDKMYGTADDGTIYFKEAIENGLRGWIRETNGHAFSFLGADFDDGNGVEANFGLTTMMQQNIEGFLMSCLGCNPHSLPTNVETVEYYWNWPGNFDIDKFDHPAPSSATITILAP